MIRVLSDLRAEIPLWVLRDVRNALKPGHPEQVKAAAAIDAAKMLAAAIGLNEAEMQASMARHVVVMPATDIGLIQAALSKLPDEKKPEKAIAKLKDARIAIGNARDKIAALHSADFANVENDETEDN